MTGCDSVRPGRDTRCSTCLRILIIDYGSQFTQLIARRVREARVYSEIHPPTRTRRVDSRLEADRHHSERRTELGVRGRTRRRADPALLDIAPVLGICYGMQLIAHLSGGEVIDAGQARVRTRRARGRRSRAACSTASIAARA